MSSSFKVPSVWVRDYSATQDTVPWYQYLIYRVITNPYWWYLKRTFHCEHEYLLDMVHGVHYATKPKTTKRHYWYLGLHKFMTHVKLICMFTIKSSFKVPSLGVSNYSTTQDTVPWYQYWICKVITKSYWWYLKRTCHCEHEYLFDMVHEVDHATKPKTTKRHHWYLGLHKLMTHIK